MNYKLTARGTTVDIEDEHGQVAARVFMLRGEDAGAMLTRANKMAAGEDMYRTLRSTVDILTEHHGGIAADV